MVGKKKKGLQVLESYNTTESKIHCHITNTEFTCNIPNRNLQQCNIMPQRCTNVT